MNILSPIPPSPKTLPLELHEQLSLSLHTLRSACERFADVRFASSMGAEDMLLIDLIARERLPIKIFTLDTLQLHPETLATREAAIARYGLSIEQIQPEAQTLKAFEAEQPIAAIYDSVDARKACCQIRKVEPLRRALLGSDAWITGQRREQSVTRASLPLEEFDAAHGITKFNPLAAWTRQALWQYIELHQVPVNALHARGFPSIGCAPCTRAIAPDEDERAGRWWWESPEHKECGLHNNPRRKINSVLEHPL